MRLLEVVGDDLERPQLIGRCGRRSSCGDTLQVGDVHVLDRADRQLEEPRAHGAEEVRRRRSSGSGTTPRVRASASMPFRASVSATSRAVSSAEKTSVTPRPKTRWKIGRMSG